jgi:hypothetical protein
MFARLGPRPDLVDVPPEQDEALHLYASAPEAYRKQLWGDALGLFEQCLALWPEDGPSRVMAERSRATVTRVRRKTGMECFSSS